jgi:hypothetical protein
MDVGRRPKPTAAVASDFAIALPGQGIVFAADMVRHAWFGPGNDYVFYLSLGAWERFTYIRA